MTFWNQIYFRKSVHFLKVHHWGGSGFNWSVTASNKDCKGKKRGSCVRWWRLYEARVIESTSYPNKSTYRQHQPELLFHRLELSEGRSPRRISPMALKCFASFAAQLAERLEMFTLKWPTKKLHMCHLERGAVFQKHKPFSESRLFYTTKKSFRKPNQIRKNVWLFFKKT